MISGADRTAPVPSDLILPAGFRLVAYDIVDSTNDEAKQLASAGAAHGTTIWACEQRAGRGRQDRRWSSPRGNLFVSFVLRPHKPPAEVAEIGFVAALSVLDLVRNTCPAQSVSLKWPNDVLVDGAKVAGILLESSMSYPDTVDWLILGIGINLLSAPSETPYKASALAAFAAVLSPEQALGVLVPAFNHWLKIWETRGFAPIRKAWLDSGTQHGERIIVKEGNGVNEGIFVDLDQDGALVLETANGIRRITAGDVYFPAG